MLPIILISLAPSYINSDDTILPLTISPLDPHVCAFDKWDLYQLLCKGFCWNFQQCNIQFSWITSIYMKGTLYFKFISLITYIKKWWWLMNKLCTTWLNENGQQMQQFANVCVVINALLKKNSFVMFVVRSSPHTNKFLKGNVVHLWFLNHHDINHNSYFSSCIVVCNLLSLWHLILIVIFSLLSKNKRD